MSKKKEQNKPIEKFPTNDRDYYYYYEIFQLKQLKEYYNSINDPILKDNLENSLLNIYEPSNTTFSKEEIYNEYRRYYDDFNFYIDKLINKDNINNNDDFKNTIEYLMVNISHTNQFINRYLILKGNKEFHSQKLTYMEEEKTVKYLLLENRHLIYKLNFDNIALVVTNFYARTIYLIILLVLNTIFWITTSDTQKLIYGIAFISLAILYLFIHNELIYAENQKLFYVSKYKYVAHPFTYKFKFSDIITTIKIFTDIFKKQ